MPLLNGMRYSSNVDRVTSVVFTVLSDEEHRKGSVCEVTTHETHLADQPKSGGLFDMKMGAVDQKHICPTCGLNNKACQGHFGHLNLAIPVINPIFVKQVIKVLQVICPKCANLRLAKLQDASGNQIKGMTRLHAFIGSKNVCERCGSACPKRVLQPRDTNYLGYIETVWGDTGKSSSTSGTDVHEYMNADKIYRIFRRIPHAALVRMGCHALYSHPKNFIMQVMPISPPCIRPSARSDHDQRMEDDLTYKLIDIVKCNTSLKKDMDALNALFIKTHVDMMLAKPDERRTRDYLLKLITPDLVSLEARTTVLATKEGQDLTNSINERSKFLSMHITMYSNDRIPKTILNQQKNGRAIKSIRKRIVGKEGNMRGNCMAKRCDFTARSVITPDPSISLEELVVPLAFCKVLTIPYTVTALNYDKLTQACMNGLHGIYPGATHVIDSKGTMVSMASKNAWKSLNDGQGLRYGDVVWHQLVDSDPVIFNRQPSLHRMNMMVHRVKVRHLDSFCMDPTVTTPYNADFDGDEMNIHLPQSCQTKQEIIGLMQVKTQIISPCNHRPIISAVQDCLVGGKLFSEQGVFFNRVQAISLLSRLRLPDQSRVVRTLASPAYRRHERIILRLKGDDSGNDGKESESIGRCAYALQVRGSASVCLSDEELSVTFLEDVYSANQIISLILPPTLSYSKGDVLIRNGQFIRGTIKDSIVGKTVNSLIHVIHNDYGRDTVVRFLNNYKWLMLNWMAQSAASIGPSDFELNATARAEIRETIDSSIEKIEVAREQLYYSRAPRKQLTEMLKFKECESNIVSRLSNTTEIMMLRTLRGSYRSNRLLAMIDSGSKGKISNASQIVTCLGQNHVEGRTIGANSQADRVFPHQSKYEESSLYSGLITHSLYDGLTPIETNIHAQGGREGLCDTSVRTSATGYSQRKIANIMTDARNDCNFTVRNASGHIIQFVYGSDGMDPTRVEVITLPSIRKPYVPDRDIRSKAIDPSLLGMYYFDYRDYQEAYNAQIDDWINELLTFRKTIILSRSKREPTSPAEQTFYSAVNFERLLMRVVETYGNANRDDRLIRPTMQTVLSDLNALMDGLKLGNTGPDLLMRMCIIDFMNPAELARRGATSDGFKQICSEVIALYYRGMCLQGELVGMVGAQSIGEPGTQLTLSGFHEAGVAGKSSLTSGVARLDQITRAAKRITTPSMTIYLNPGVSAKEVIHSILCVRVSHIYERSYVEFLDKADFERYRAIYRSIAGPTAALPDEGDVFHPWRLVIKLNHVKMAEHGTSAVDVWNSIESYFSSSIWTHLEHAELDQLSTLSIFIRINQPDFLDQSDQCVQTDVLRVFNALQSTILRDIIINGLPTITSCTIHKADHNYKYDEATGEYVSYSEEYIEARGTGLSSILGHPGVDVVRTTSNDIYDIYLTLGVDAAKNAIQRELQSVFSAAGVFVGARHIELLACAMTCRGIIMSCDRHGLNKSDARGPFTCSAFEEAAETLFTAAAHNSSEVIATVPTKILFGQEISVGAGSVDVMIDEARVDELTRMLVNEIQEGERLRAAQQQYQWHQQQIQNQSPGNSSGVAVEVGLLPAAVGIEAELFD